MDVRIDNRLIAKHMEHQDKLIAIINKFKESIALGMNLGPSQRIELQGIHYVISRLDEGNPKVKFDDERNAYLQEQTSLPPQSQQSLPITDRVTYQPQSQIASAATERHSFYPPPIGYIAPYTRGGPIQMPQNQQPASSMMYHNEPVPSYSNQAQYFPNSFTMVPDHNILANQRQMSSTTGSTGDLGLPIVPPSRVNHFNMNCPALSHQVDRVDPRPISVIPITQVNQTTPPAPQKQSTFNCIFDPSELKDCFLEENFQEDLSLIQVRDDNSPETTSSATNPIVKSEPMETDELSDKVVSSIMDTCDNLSLSTQDISDLPHTSEQPSHSNHEELAPSDEAMEDIPPVKTEPTVSHIVSIPDQSLRTNSVKEFPVTEVVTKDENVQASQKLTPDTSSILEPAVSVPMVSQTDQVSPPIGASFTSQNASEESDLSEFDKEQLRKSQEEVERFRAKLRNQFPKPDSPTQDDSLLGTASSDNQVEMKETHSDEQGAILNTQTPSANPEQVSKPAKAKRAYPDYASSSGLSSVSSTRPSSLPSCRKSSLKNEKSAPHLAFTKKVRFSDKNITHDIPACGEELLYPEVDSVRPSGSGKSMSPANSNQVPHPRVDSVNSKFSKKKKQPAVAGSPESQDPLIIARPVNSIAVASNPSAPSSEPSKKASGYRRAPVYAYNSQEMAPSCSSSGQDSYQKDKPSKSANHKQLIYRERWDQVDRPKKRSEDSSQPRRSYPLEVSEPNKKMQKRDTQSQKSQPSRVSKPIEKISGSSSQPQKAQSARVPEPIKEMSGSSSQSQKLRSVRVPEPIEKISESSSHSQMYGPAKVSKPIEKLSGSSSQSQKSRSASAPEPIKKIGGSSSHSQVSGPGRAPGHTKKPSASGCFNTVSNSVRPNNEKVAPAWSNPPVASPWPHQKVASPIKLKENSNFFSLNSFSGHFTSPSLPVARKNPSRSEISHKVSSSKSRYQEKKLTLVPIPDNFEAESPASPVPDLGNFFSFNENEVSPAKTEESVVGRAGSPEPEAAADMFAGLKSYLDAVKENQLNSVSYFNSLPDVRGFSLDNAFIKHWDYYHDLADPLISDDDIFQVYLDYFVSLAYLGFNYKGNLEYYTKKMIKDYYLYKHGGRGNPMPYATPERYISWMKCAWVILSYVGPAFYLNCQDSLPLSQFVAISESSDDLKSFLQDNGYVEEYTYTDWNFNKFSAI